MNVPCNNSLNLLSLRYVAQYFGQGTIITYYDARSVRKLSP